MKFLSAKSCAAKFDICVNTWYDWAKYDPTAPKPIVKAGEEKSAWSRWDEDAVDAYQQLLIKEQRTGYVAEAHKKKGKKAA